MTTDRFEFQRGCVQRALDGLDRDEMGGEQAGAILNVGCNDDPGHLKSIDPDRVINCDLFEHDQVLDRPNVVDRVFDCARDRWPFDGGQAALVVLGDILEHLTPEEIGATLAEARRVGRRLCVSVPEDHREETSNERADLYPRGAVHRTIVTRGLLAGLLIDAGWTIVEWREVEYDSGVFWGQRTMGHFVEAE